MIDFEIKARDGFARIGRFSTPHGPVDTPALLPVVHPDPRSQSIAPSEIVSSFGLPALITSSYILWRSSPLRERAEQEGIHRLLGVSGPVFTDSGAFQQHAYGHVEVDPEVILAFQGRIGSDIAAVLDVFGEPEASSDDARHAVEVTLERARAARAAREGLLAVPVQGGRFPELRWTSAAGASALGDVLAVGGVVPLLEQYRFADLARVLLGARPALAPERAVHLFGTGHPITFAFAALFGVDLFDSAAYHKFARRGSLLFPEGTVDLADVREPFCGCRLCEKLPLTEIGDLPAAERETAVARHNLWMCATEVRRVRQAIREEALWELAERRAAAHPALMAGLRTAVQGASVFLPVEPDSRPSFREVTAVSPDRPAVAQFRQRLARWPRLPGPGQHHDRVPLTPEPLGTIPTTTPDGLDIAWVIPSPVGLVPLELSEVYPVGAWVGPEEFDRARAPDPSDSANPHRMLTFEESRRVAAWTVRQVRAILAWEYPGLGAAVDQDLAVGVRSPKTGRLRDLSVDGASAFRVGNDGLPRPSWVGAQWLHRKVPAPSQRVVVQPDAVPFVREGRSLFARFVAGADPSITPGTSVLLVDESDDLLAVGRAELAAFEMVRFKRGTAVWVTAHARKPVPTGPDPDRDARPAES